MNLSELHTHQSGIIVKVKGHGGFRKRIVEMGFVKGQEVKVLQNAPLQDPVKYKIMGYEVSLRRSEAALIEVVTSASDINRHDDDVMNVHNAEMTASVHAYEKVLHEHPFASSSERVSDMGNADDCDDYHEQRSLKDEAERKRKYINVALVGNPNCGKTSLFNLISGAHERVGNYSGVTVDAKEGYAEYNGYRFIIVDLPGTYSLSAYSPEELYVRKQIVEHTPDVIIDVIDSSNLERNLYLTTQLIDMHLSMVVALNMFDEAEERGDLINVDKLSQLFGVPMVPTVFTSGHGVDALFSEIIRLYESAEGDDPHFRHIHINHGHEIEKGISDIQEHLKQELNLRQLYSTRYLAIKLLEHDSEVETYVRTLPDADEILLHRDHSAARVKEETGDDSETAIMDAKYGFIHGALEEARYDKGSNKDTYQTTHLIDSVLTNKFIGLPIFLAVLGIMFITTFGLGAYPMSWIEAAVDALRIFVGEVIPGGWLRDMLVDGVIGGVGSVIVFLPQILILYFFISFMEDCGYMARAAFIMDKMMHKMGLHGKSFIPLIMGFGCNVPAIMATRTIESRKSRLVTMLIVPLMSCEARIPVYIMIIGTFFSTSLQPLLMMSLYLIGVLLAVLVSKIFTKYLVKGDDTPFVMELPPYRFPTWKAVSRHTWEKGFHYLKKMGGVILAASIVVWALGYFPHDESLSHSEQLENSYIGVIGKTVEPIFTPLGFNWKLDMGIVAGVGAKEIVASTVSVLYAEDITSFKEEVTPLAALSFLLFVLIYFPCLATVSAIRGETGRWRWAVFAAGYTTILAWLISAAVYQLGSLFV